LCGVSIRFDDIEFLPETEALFCEMVETTMKATRASGRQFVIAQHMGGSHMIFVGPPRRDWEDVDEGALTDLATYGLLQLGYSSRGTPNYRVSSDGHRYYRYLQERRGTPVVQVEEMIRRLIDGEAFSRRYPKSVAALSKATQLLWTGETDDQTASELGAALRATLQDFVDELLQRLGVHSTLSREQPISRLREAVDAIRDRIGAREQAVMNKLVELADVELREVQRIHHVRHEGPVKGWDEMRRATFVLTLLIHELDLAAGSPP
jgi:hypothetical protein